MDGVATVRLACALREIRARHRLTQQALADQWGCAQAQIGKLEAMATESPGVRWFELLRKDFGVPWDYFVAPGPPDLSLADYEATLPHATRLESRLDRIERALDLNVHRPPQTGERVKTGKQASLDTRDRRDGRRSTRRPCVPCVPRVQVRRGVAAA